MSTILEKLREMNMAKESSSLEFSNYGATSNISRKFNESYKDKMASGGKDTLLQEMRAKNMARANETIGFGNDLAQSDISRNYIEKYKAASNPAPAATGGTSLLESLRKKHMDDTTSKM